MSWKWIDRNHQVFSAEEYLINNGRLTITRGRLLKETVSIPLAEIVDCRMSQSFVQRMKGFCTIYLTRENDQKIILMEVEYGDNYYPFQDIIDEVGRARTAAVLMQQTRRHLFWGQDAG